MSVQDSLVTAATVLGWIAVALVWGVILFGIAAAVISRLRRRGDAAVPTPLRTRGAPTTAASGSIYGRARHEASG